MLISIDLPISEILDRITICEIKLDHIRDEAKCAHIRKELGMLQGRLATVDLPEEVLELVPRLRASNDENFCQIEVLFEREAAGDVGVAYASAARAAFRANADRAHIKRRINDLLNSEIVEEKTY